MNNANPCNDGNACTQTDTCTNGTCAGANPVVCTAADQCHTGTCAPATGACSSVALPDGTVCHDTDLCTRGETCQAGACTSATNGLIEPGPKTSSYYMRLCRGSQSDDRLTNADALCVASISQTFARFRTVADICAEIWPDHPEADACDRAENNLAFLALNVCRGRVCTGQRIFSQCGDNTKVGHSLAESDAIFAGASRDSQNCGHAQCLDDEINSGRALQLTSLFAHRDGIDVRLDWTVSQFTDGTGPANYHVWRRALGSLEPFTHIASTVDPTYLDTTAANGSYQYEVTAVMN
jgi:hypothetical protein